MQLQGASRTAVAQLQKLLRRIVRATAIDPVGTVTARVFRVSLRTERPMRSGFWRRRLRTAYLGAVVGLCGCGAAAAEPATAPASSATIPIARVFPSASSNSSAPTGGPLSPSPTAAAGTVHVRTFKELDDYAHRNYCGAGATEVLLSAWKAQTPDIEPVARAGRLDPKSGETGANAVIGIDALLAALVIPILGHDRYVGEHVNSRDAVLAALRADLTDPQALRLFGHGVPVMVQTMTRTMPGWNGCNATHMITIFAADLRSGNPDVDTISYAETPSVIAAYRGPPLQTITVSRLWTAMQQFIVDSPADPIKSHPVISAAA